MQNSGEIFTQDDYKQQYRVSWSTVNGVIDITTITFQPYVWGEQASAYKNNGVLFRRGTVSVHRQILQNLDNGYEIIAEGSSQYVDYWQMDFPCGSGPSDNFAYHLDCYAIDDIEIAVDEGPRWASSIGPIWAELQSDGTVIESTGEEYLSWVDIWQG